MSASRLLERMCTLRTHTIQGKRVRGGPWIYRPAIESASKGVLLGNGVLRAFPRGACEGSFFRYIDSIGDLELTFVWFFLKVNGHLTIVMNMICDMMGHENE